jgi:hypothetical protein
MLLLIGFFGRAGFCRALVRGEGVIPETIEVRPEGFDARRVQLVEAAVSIRTIDDQVRLFENSQVLRDRRAADREGLRELADRLRSLKQSFEDGSPGWIAECVQLPSMMVSNH